MVADTESVVMCFAWFFPADQRLDLNKLGPNDNDTVRGQIVGKKHKRTQFQLHTVHPNIKFNLNELSLTIIIKSVIEI